MKGASPYVILVASLLAASGTRAQEFFRCTTPDGKVTYQQAPCAKTDAQSRIDATPANTDFDPGKRERILREGEEAGRRLEARAAEERAAAQRREEEAQRREAEAQAREAAREEPVYVIGGPGYHTWPPPVLPRPPARPVRPAPQPSRP